MIVAETADGYRLVTQPDHAALAGQFADHWGNDSFDRPAPTIGVRIAAYDHDDGWWSYDRRPHLADDGSPVDFREMDPVTWIELYEAGIDAVVDLDPYAGLLVSMHGAGLRRRRYGLSPSWSSTPADFAAFVDRQEARQAALAHELHEDGGRVSADDRALLATLHDSGSPTDGTDGRLWRNYALLQAWDTLSLSFCTTTSPPAHGTIDAVPTAPGTADATLNVDPLGDDVVRVSPYPFDVDPLVVTVPTRTVSGTSFDDEDRLLAASFESTRSLRSFELQA